MNDPAPDENEAARAPDGWRPDALQPILDAMPLLFFHRDRHDRIVRVNAAVAETLGVRPRDMVGTPTARWYPEEAWVHRLQDLAVIRSGRPRLAVVERLPAKGAAKRWICTDRFPHRNADGEIDGVLAFARDVAADTEAEAAFARHEERLQSVLATAPEVMLVLDEDGRILEVFGNTSSANLVSEPEDMVGRLVEELLPKDVADAGQFVIDRTLATRSLQEYDYALDIRGAKQHFSARVVPLDHRERPCVLWSARNVTEHRKTEENRRLLEHQLLQAQKLESLGVLAGGMAHDFNNLLVVILANADVAAEGLAADSRAADCLRAIQDGAMRAGDLCQRMLAYSGRRVLSLKPVDLSALIRNMTGLLDASVSDGVRLRIDADSELPPVAADAAQIRQVVLSLVTNASEAIGDASGEISISTGTTACDASFLAGCAGGGDAAAGGYAYIECADTGPGMDESVTARIFDPFFTTKFPGRGLGLAATLGIARSHAGAIHVSSRPGRGTVIRILVPISENGSSPEQGPSATPVGEAASGTVLFVDDEAAILAVGKRILESSGFSVLTAQNGVEAVEALRASDEVACVVLDLTMPELGGIEAHRKMREIRPDVPVILSSGYRTDEVTSRFVQEGFAGFLQKPYAARRMLEIVSRCLSD